MSWWWRGRCEIKSEPSSACAPVARWRPLEEVNGVVKRYDTRELLLNFQKAQAQIQRQYCQTVNFDFQSAESCHY